MPKEIINCITLSILINVLYSCNESEVKINLPVQNDTSQISGIERDIPQSKEWKWFYSYTYIYAKKYEGMEGFKKLDNGFDSLCIRIHYDYSFERKGQVIEFRKTKAGWEAEFFSLIKTFRPDSDSVASVNNTSILKQPKSGWDYFIKELWALDITKLPDDSQIPEYSTPMDANGVIIQVATKSSYRIYGYSSPRMNTNIEAAKKMEDIMELIEKEFGEKRLKTF